MSSEGSGGEIVDVVTSVQVIEGKDRLSTMDRLDLGRVSYQISVDDRSPLKEARGILFADHEVIGYASPPTTRSIITNVIATEAEFRLSGSTGPS